MTSPYLAPMVRFTALVAALACALVMLAPSLYLLEFAVRKAYIQRELCVQRDVVEGMRTCHGECQLSKKFRALEEEAQQGFPAERFRIHQDPMVPHALVDVMWIRLVIEQPHPDRSIGTAEGFARVSEPVPWC